MLQRLYWAILTDGSQIALLPLALFAKDRVDTTVYMAITEENPGWDQRLQPAAASMACRLPPGPEGTGVFIPLTARANPKSSRGRRRSRRASVSTYICDDQAGTTASAGQSTSVDSSHAHSFGSNLVGLPSPEHASSPSTYTLNRPAIPGQCLPARATAISGAAAASPPLAGGVTLQDLMDEIKLMLHQMGPEVAAVVAAAAADLTGRIQDHPGAGPTKTAPAPVLSLSDPGSRASATLYHPSDQELRFPASCPLPRTRTLPRGSSPAAAQATARWGHSSSETLPALLTSYSSSASQLPLLDSYASEPAPYFAGAGAACGISNSFASFDDSFCEGQSPPMVVRNVVHSSLGGLPAITAAVGSPVPLTSLDQELLLLQEPSWCPPVGSRMDEMSPTLQQGPLHGTEPGSGSWLAYQGCGLEDDALLGRLTELSLGCNVWS